MKIITITNLSLYMPICTHICVYAYTYMYIYQTILKH